MAMYPGTIDQLESGYTGMDQWDCIYLGDEKIWPTSSHLTPIIQQISEETGNYPIHFCEFNNSLAQTPIPLSSNPNQVYKPNSWASRPSAYIFLEGVAGRKALYCSTTDIKLDLSVKHPKRVCASMLIKQTFTNSSYSGVLGGTIFGLNTKGFGYALGWSPSVRSNKFCAECYAGSGSAAQVYSSTSMTANKWYHVMVDFQADSLTATQNSPRAHICINGTWVRAISYPGKLGELDYSSLSEAQNDSYIHLGCVWQNGKYYFKGYIQDFVLWTNFSLYDNPTLDKLIVDYYKGLNII